MSSECNRPELALIVPAFNEEAAIESVVDDWIDEMQRLHIDYELRVYDDGSSDGTRRVLERLAARNPRIVPTSHPNRGHGPTLVRGYREACSDWVFQIDADGEMGPDGFEGLWVRRHEFDFLLGYRTGRQSGPGRRLITFCARHSVRWLFGSRLRDVNTPYRLMRASALRAVLPAVDEQTFAPNVILLGTAARRGLRIDEQPVRHRPRRGGTPSLVRWRLWRAAMRAFRQTLAAARAGARQ